MEVFIAAKEGRWEKRVKTGKKAHEEGGISKSPRSE